MSTRITQLSQQTLVTGSTAQQFNATPIIAYSVLVRANSSNIGVVYIGDSGVTSQNCSIALSPDQTFLLDNVDFLNGHEKVDLATLYWIGTTGDKVMVSYTVRI